MNCIHAERPIKESMAKTLAVKLLLFWVVMSGSSLSALHAAETDGKGAAPKNIDELLALEKQFGTVSTQAMKSVVAIQIGKLSGSGVIVSEDGLILTAGHVVKEPGQKAVFTMTDGRTFRGVGLGMFKVGDAGMMKITDKGKFPAAKVAPKESIVTGSWCVMMGHPLGYEADRSPVVRVGRVLDVENRTIRTDCAMILGDSGGPLFNLKGEVIGINSRIRKTMTQNYHVNIDVFHNYWDRMKNGEACVDKIPLRGVEEVKTLFQKVIADTTKCVVRIRCEEKDVVLGTIVGPDGWILTKASELKGRAVVRLQDGRDLEARTVGVNEKFDLAMLKIDATDLPNIRWGMKDPTVGQWVVVPGMDQEPLALGVISVARRAIPPTRGMLGVAIDEAKSGVVITDVIEKGPAEKAGLKPKDTITRLNGDQVADRKSFLAKITHFRSGTKVTLIIERDGKKIEKTITLDTIVNKATKKRDKLNATGGGRSKRHNDFPVVLQHDGVLRPADCGSPLVTLEGCTVGINIARAGRTETYCVPANALIPLMYDLMSGSARPHEVQVESKPQGKVEDKGKSIPKEESEPKPGRQGPK